MHCKAPWLLEHGLSFRYKHGCHKVKPKQFQPFIQELFAKVALLYGIGDASMFQIAWTQMLMGMENGAPAGTLMTRDSLQAHLMISACNRCHLGKGDLLRYAQICLEGERVSLLSGNGDICIMEGLT